MSVLSEQEKNFLQGYSQPLWDAYDKISELLSNNGMEKHFKKTCVLFLFCDKEMRRNGIRHHVTIYFEAGFLKFFVRHDDYRFRRNRKDLPNTDGRKNELRGRLGYRVDTDRSQDYFYVAVPNTDRIDALIDYIKHIFP